MIRLNFSLVTHLLNFASLLYTDRMKDWLSKADCQLYPKDENIIYYKGVFSDNVLSRISTNIRKKMSTSKILSKKLFSIFIELGQNVALYSAETNNYGDLQKGQGVGVVRVNDNGSSYELTVANMIEKGKSAKLIDRITRINKLDEKSLRKFKIEQREQPREEGQLGGNIGLIHVALQAGNPFTFDVKQMNDRYDYLILNIEINKN